MRTGCWFTLDPKRFAPVGISIGIPRGIRYPHADMKALAPTWEMVRMAKGGGAAGQAEYDRRFEAILAGLDPQETWSRIHAEAERIGPGLEPALLCWERPPFHAKNRCHRRHVARWLEEALGASVPEIGDPAQAPPGIRDARPGPPAGFAPHAPGERNGT